MEGALAAYYGGWANYQRLLVEAVRPLSEAQLDLRAAPRLWSIRTLANHVVAARAWWFHDWMREGGPEFDGMAGFDEGAGADRRPAAAIVDGLDMTWALVDSCLARWTGDDLDARFSRPGPTRPGESPWRDRRYIVWHVAEHDLHHGGEISFSLGMNGIPGIDL